MNRTHVTLGIVLLVQIALILLMRGPLGGAGARSGVGALLPQLESMTVQKIEVTDGAGETVTLDRVGDAWAVESLDGYPADGQKIDDTLEKLRAVDGRRPVVSSARHHEALKVADETFERRVRLWGDAEENAKIEFFIGTSANYQVSHVRRGGDDHVYEGQNVSAFDFPANPASWASRQLVDVTLDAISSVEVANQNGRFALEKRDGIWRVKEPSAQSARTLDQERVATFVRMLAPLYVSKPAGRRGAEQGLDQAVAAVTLRTGPQSSDAASAGGHASQIITLEVGAQVPDADGLRYAAVAGSEFAAVIAKNTAETLMNERLSDLLQ